MTFDTGENLGIRWYVMHCAVDGNGEVVTRYDGPTTMDRAIDIKRAYVEKHKYDYLFFRTEREYVDNEHTLGIYLPYDPSGEPVKPNTVSIDEDIPF